MEENNKYLTTEEGLQALKEELKEREGVLRKEISDTLNEMRNQGDLRENDGYSMAVEKQNSNETKILELKEKIKNAKIVKSVKKEKVSVGDTVTLEGKNTLTYTIVSEDEANPLEGKISYLSPLGKEVFGKKLKDEVLSPNGEDKYKIMKIN